MGGGYHQSNYDRLMRAVGLKPELEVNVMPRSSRKTLHELQDIQERKILRKQGVVIRNGVFHRISPPRRKLLGYRGDTISEHVQSITLQEEDWMSWVSALEE